MKFLKVRITRNTGPGPSMQYPERYNAQEVDRHGRGPLNVMGAHAYSGGLGMGEAEEHCIILLSDALADEYVQDPDMEVVTADEADTLMESWRQTKVSRGFERDERVEDAQRIEVIRAKQGAGIALSAEDTKALDPDDPTPGINRGLRSVKQKFGTVLER